MSTASAKSSDQDYFVGFSKPCESADDNESVATSAPDWSITDTAPESVADQDAEATGTRVSRLQDEPVVRLPRAAQLPLVVGLPQAYTQLDPPNATSIAAETMAPQTLAPEILAPEIFAPESWGRTPLSQRPRYSLSGMKILLIVATIVPPIAFIFYAFGNLPPKLNIATLWTRSPIIQRQAATPAPLPKAPLSTIQPQDIPVSTRANKEVQAPPLQAAGQVESGPSENDMTIAQTTPDLQNRTRESGTAEDKSSAIPNMSPDGEASRRREAQESSSPKMDTATASTAPPIDTPPAMPTPLPQALPVPTEAQGIAARIESEPEVQAPPMQTTTRSDSLPNTITGQLTALRPTSGVDGMTIDSSTTDHKIGAAPDLGLGSEAPRLREAPAGVWTYCTVDLIPRGQIAVQKAMTYPACISAGKKCAGNRRYADIQFFDRPTMTSKAPLELCYTES
jgi:hypothetical protein